MAGIAQLNCQIENAGERLKDLEQKKAEIERLGLLRDQMEAQLDAIAVQAKTAHCN